MVYSIVKSIVETVANVETVKVDDNINKEVESRVIIDAADDIAPAQEATSENMVENVCIREK